MSILILISKLIFIFFLKQLILIHEIFEIKPFDENDKVTDARPVSGFIYFFICRRKSIKKRENLQDT